MLEWSERILDTALAFDESTTKSLDIPRDNPIQQIVCEFFVVFVNGTSPVETDDGLLEIIQNVKLVTGAKDVKFSKSGRQWYYLEKDDMKSAPYRTTFDTTNSATHTEKVVMVHHFQADPFDRQDFSALLPANRFSSLVLSVQWATKDDVSTNITSITDASSGVNVQIREVSGTVTTDKGEVDIGSVGFADIREDAKVIAIPPNKTSFDTATLKENITPSPANILKKTI